MSELPTFHIQYPSSNTFLTWDELGCLSRALGFPSDLFLRYHSQEVGSLSDDNKGIFIKTFDRLIHQVSFQSVLHRTYNMHTSQWNVKVIEYALIMLEHKVLDFDGVYKVRIAYTTYEHGDMKGMLLNKNILMRTLKFCGRVISPLKLMHRVKHMKEKLEERGRIQLYEFFGLILWCDMYTSYNPSDVQNTSGKVGDLFKIVDVYSLLSHHDERLVNQLNDQYLKEERCYGTFQLGSRSRPKFADLVVYTEPRINLVNFHNEKYRFLKQEITESDKRVNQAHAGSIRNRPISAPDLSRYKEINCELGDETTGGEIGRNTMSNRLHSAPARVKSNYRGGTPAVETSGPLFPYAVSADDVAEINAKMAALNFDKTTLECRTQLNMEAEIDYYLPGYLEKRPSSEAVTCIKPAPVKKPGHWTVDIIQRLTNPGSLKGESHFRCCSASETSMKGLLNKTASKSKVPTTDGHSKTARGLNQNKGKSIEPSTRSTHTIDLNSEDNVENCNTEGLNFDLCVVSSKHSPGCNSVLGPPQNNKSLIAEHVCGEKPEQGNGHGEYTEKTLSGKNASRSLQDKTTEAAPFNDVTGSCSSLLSIGSGQNEAEIINNLGNKKVTWGSNSILMQLTDQFDTSRNLIEPVTTIKDSHGIYRLIESGEPLQDKATEEKQNYPTISEINNELDIRLGVRGRNDSVNLCYDPNNGIDQNPMSNVSSFFVKTLSMTSGADVKRQGQIKGGNSPSLVVLNDYKLRADRQSQLTNAADRKQDKLDLNSRVKKNELSKSYNDSAVSISPVITRQDCSSVCNTGKNGNKKTRRIAQNRLLKQLHRSSLRPAKLYF